MTYQETTEYLFRATPVFEHIGAAAYKPGLDTMRRLDEMTGHPHRRYPTIHVAGTNGKGSTAHTLAAILQEDGKRVGLFTSPHLVDFRERMRVNGQMVSEQWVMDFVERWRAEFEPLHPSFFELTTAMAFLWFAEQEVDIAVIEVGLGGRLDSTNIITPVLSVITNISKDHTQFLGDTLAQIAGEKAGIIKAGVPVVIGETNAETWRVFVEKAAEAGAPITFAETTDAVPVLPLATHPIFDCFDFGLVRFALCGDYQKKNALTILAAAEQLLLMGVLWNKDSVYAGFAHVCEDTGLQGRWQTLQERPLVICDTGHNLAGWQCLAPQIARQACLQRRIVFGMVDDKDYRAVMRLLPRDATYYWTAASTHRAIPAERIAAEGAADGLTGRTCGTVWDAYQAALHDAVPEDFIFVGGSSYVVADLLSELRKKS